MDNEAAKLQDHSREPSSEDRLNSWKEIAAYLKCSERTVRRWEEEGLPVRRHTHKTKAAIYAYKAEIDAWWRDGHDRMKPVKNLQDEAVSDWGQEGTDATPEWWRRPWLGVAIMAALAF